MKLALHRSITFWSGLLVMFFIAWAWRDSFHRLATISHDRFELVSAHGGVSIGYFPAFRFPFLAAYRPSPRPYTHWQPIQALTFQRGTNVKVSPSSGTVENAQNAQEFYCELAKGHPPNHWFLFIPYWLLLLASTLPLLALLFWRARRRKSIKAP